MDIEIREDGTTLRNAITLCGWFALCENPADGTVTHPILGEVPTCLRCAERHELELN